MRLTNENLAVCAFSVVVEREWVTVYIIRCKLNNKQAEQPIQKKEKTISFDKFIKQ